MAEKRPDEYVVLHNGLSRRMERMPEEEFKAMQEAAPGMLIPQYRVMPAYERGDVVSAEEISGPYFGTHDNIKRLLAVGAIGPADHPDAAAAFAERELREQHEKALVEGRAG